MIKEKDMEHLVGQMGVSMQVSGEVVNNTEKEHTSVLKVRKKQVYGRMAKKLNGQMQMKNDQLVNYKLINFYQYILQNY